MSHFMSQSLAGNRPVGHRRSRELVGCRLRRYHDGMTMAQLLKRVRTLPTKQRDRLMREILALQDGLRQPPARRPRARITWPDVEARARQITGDRVIPNLVLLERGEESH